MEIKLFGLYPQEWPKKKNKGTVFFRLSHSPPYSHQSFQPFVWLHPLLGIWPFQVKSPKSVWRESRHVRRRKNLYLHFITPTRHFALFKVSVIPSVHGLIIVVRIQQLNIFGHPNYLTILDHFSWKCFLVLCFVVWITGKTPKLSIFVQ